MLSHIDREHNSGGEIEAVRRQTATSGINPAGSSRDLRLDPLSLPVSFSARDSRADGGVRQIEPERLYETAKLCLENDLQFMAHSVGDGAVEALIEAYRRIDERDFPVRPQRPCITHCNFMSAEAIRESELERALRRLHHLSERDRNEVAALSSAIVNKLLHDPITGLKAGALD